MLSKANPRLLLRLLLHSSPTIQLASRLCCSTVSGDTPSPSPPSPKKQTPLHSPRRKTSSGTSFCSEGASSLYRRLSALNTKGSSSSSNVEQVLNEWISTQGKSATQADILVYVDYLRRFKKFDHALQLLEWTERRGLIHLSPREHAIRIVLLGKTRGVEAAEKYFADLPESTKRKSTHGALLHCYCSAKMSEKAMELLQEMKTRNLPLYAFEYCNLMSLHMKLGQPEKVTLLAKEMKEKHIKPHIFSYILLINSYASLKDIEAIEEIEEEITTGSGIRPDWSFYSNLAAIYIAAGLLEKAELTLKEIEKLRLCDPRAFHSLLSLYASIGKAEEVNRVWRSLKHAFPKINNLSYLTMLQTLFRLKDMDGLKRCFEEWESACSSYDVRLAYVLIKAFLQRDMIDEAKSLLDHILDKGYELNFATYALFVEFFTKILDMDIALKFMELGTTYVKKVERMMYEHNTHMLLKYLKREKDVCHAKELYKILKQANCLDTKVRDSLLLTNMEILKDSASAASQDE